MVALIQDDGEKTWKGSIAENYFSFEPKSNFSGHKFVSQENKNFWTNKKNWSQNLLLEFFKFVKMQLLQLCENHENEKKS